MPARDLIMVIYGDHVISELNSTSLRRFFPNLVFFFGPSFINKVHNGVPFIF